jgi:cell division transport system permease protein
MAGGAVLSLRRALYFLVRAAANLRLNFFATSMNVFTLTASLVLLGVVYVMFCLFQSAVPSWMTDVNAVVYLRAEVSDAEGQALADKIGQWPEVEQVKWVSEEAAWHRLKTQLSQWRDIFDGFDHNPLPASIEITFKHPDDPATGIDPIVHHLKQLPEVESVQTGEVWLNRFDSFLKLVKFVAGAVILVVTLITIVIISNTVKLTIFSRLDELEIYQIIGAGPVFTKTPFYLEAVIQGVIGALLAMPFLQMLIHLSRKVLPEPFADLLPWTAADASSLLLVLLGAGVLLTCTGSWLALRRFLKT